MSKGIFVLHSKYIPSGDQTEAIARLVSGLESGAHHQTLKGITGSGKTFTMANVIQQMKKPTLILAPNKTLTAQLYDEMRHFFPENAVEYFVSYYDYFQPEVYLPGADRFIQKDSAINAQLERLRLSTTKSLIERPDTIVVASVSSIYGLGDPKEYRAMQVPLAVGVNLDPTNLLRRLDQLSYEPCKQKLKRGMYRDRGGVVDIFPADSEYKAVRVHFSNGMINALQWIDPTTEKNLGKIEKYLVSPKTLFSPSSKQIDKAVVKIQQEMEKRVEELNNENRLVEADRLYERISNDIEMLKAVGYCSGVENYACYLNDRDPASPPVTLLDYLPKDGLLFVDESHVMIPQISAMYRGDQSRKDTLIDYGFRLPSSKNSHPLSFEEFEKIKPQTIFVSATPGRYELEKSRDLIVEQIVRPTGLLDPEVEVRKSQGAVDDLLKEIKSRVSKKERVLVTTLTKIAAEELHDYLASKDIRVRYMHSDIKTDERAEILNGLRSGEFDVLIGISLLREGLDIPEASLIAILDADQAGFLRSTHALIQMIGRVARNVHGKAILYADTMTVAMKEAIAETSNRRKHQIAYNEENNVKPVSSIRKLPSEKEPTDKPVVHTKAFCKNLTELCERIIDKEHEFLTAADNGDEVNLEGIRHELDGLYRQFIYL